MKKVLYIIIFLNVFINCAPKVGSSITNSNFKELGLSTEVIVLDSITPPDGSVAIGEIKIGDTGFTTDCGYNKIIEEAKVEARKHGANLIQITELKRPQKWGSTCYKIKGNLFRNFNADSILQIISSSADSKSSRLPIGADYAVVYFYRPKMITGLFEGYKVRMDNDSVVCRVRNGEKCEIKLKDYGKHTFWAKTETKDSIVIDVKKGQEYFIRCSMNPGVLLFRPDLNLIENHIAISEYNSVKE